MYYLNDVMEGVSELVINVNKVTLYNKVSFININYSNALTNMN